ncbi:MAG: DMP19 family protein [Bacteroidetes bacterium]|nr:DMP19 family protein [Bacteroidota bacterium]
MEKLSNRAIISRLYTSAEHQLEEANIELDSWSHWYNTLQAFTIPEKMVYVLVKMNQTVTNGGFVEFYESSIGIFAPEIIHALNQINAGATAEIISNSLSIVNPNGFLDESYKDHVFNIQLSEQQRAQLYTFDIRYDQLHGLENLEDLLGGFLQDYLN